MEPDYEVLDSLVLQEETQMLHQIIIPNIKEKFLEDNYCTDEFEIMQAFLAIIDAGESFFIQKGSHITQEQLQTIWNYCKKQSCEYKSLCNCSKCCSLPTQLIHNFWDDLVALIAQSIKDKELPGICFTKPSALKKEEKVENEEISTNKQAVPIQTIALMKASDLLVNPLNKILPPLTHEQRDELKERIKTYGFREPVEVTPNLTILDGHNRVEIAKELGYSEVPIVLINILPEDEERYIISKNFSRRQLTPEQQSFLRGRIYQHEKKTVGAPLENQNASRTCLQTISLKIKGFKAIR